MAFYRALGYGKSVKLAFGLGCSQVSLESLSDHDVPRLLALNGSPSEIFLANNAEDGDLEFSFIDDDEWEEQDESPAAKKLSTFQVDIYNKFDALGIQSYADYRHLAERERDELKQEVLFKMAGLHAGHAADLLNLSHVNTRFPGNLLSQHPNRWTVLHRKIAIYSDHAVIDAEAIKTQAQRLYAGNSSRRRQDGSLQDQAVELLFQHRPLIEQGKMSIVPKMLKRLEADGTETVLFDIRNLGAVKVNLQDEQVRSAFLRQGTLLRPAGSLVFKSPHGMGLRLDQILEIIRVKYPTEYEFFQASLRKTMTSINPQDDTHALRHAIQEVDEGILELEVKYQQARRSLNEPMKGGLALVLYASEEEDLATFVQAAFQGTKLSDLVSFAPTPQHIPPEVRQSPFFIPWFVHHQGRVNQGMLKS